MAALLYTHLATVIALMLVDAMLALTFNKKYPILKSLLKRTIWPFYAVIYLLAVYLITNGNKKVGELFQSIR